MIARVDLPEQLGNVRSKAELIIVRGICVQGVSDDIDLQGLSLPQCRFLDSHRSLLADSALATRAGQILLSADYLLPAAFNK
ncbi:hypothetical protein HL653_23630 [Sphingomonas sp. AP4-R1]|uniref:hypothetical protein n=1 Tax=Sphingomonas sp. AP4-R1 TaxID=2735134 RepID=UPI0014934C6A|nr:hypothetical protein [Sphingomonas sp. AP4-R1]QJU60325.1 hypothetical protein HL653_23630 [Sphingomonas sp. AP4-R1]